ncbi:SGNH hydrolase domain-containing protein, partial [Nocardioides sp. AE5]|uniref:SGNH hydrolase domain-containing protein n=1 Tax=Nocardioides sp. AE5 TaxID=2962573 RepID=UPI0028819034
SQGAAVFDQSGAGTVEGLADIEWFVPDAAQAAEDVPAAYPNGCQQTELDSTPITCEYGDLDSETVIVVVGDSKVLQYESPLTRIAEDEGWHVISFTMSACAFSTGMQARSGAPYTNCADWNDQVLDEVLDLKPDLLLNSQRSNAALTDPTDPDSGDSDAMVDAVAERWQQLADVGIPVATIVDNPTPDLTVYECVADNPDDLAKCTFDRDEGTRTSAAPVQRAAAERVDNVTLIDLNDYICPDEQCVPVIGNVLVYRQTSHLTDTYARTLEPELRKQLVPLLEAAG